jgi:hypothetical protein
LVLRAGRADAVAGAVAGAVAVAVAVAGTVAVAVAVAGAVAVAVTVAGSAAVAGTVAVAVAVAVAGTVAVAVAGGSPPGPAAAGSGRAGRPWKAPSTWAMRSAAFVTPAPSTTHAPRLIAGSLNRGRGTLDAAYGDRGSIASDVAVSGVVC